MIDSRNPTEVFTAVAPHLASLLSSALTSQLPVADVQLLRQSIDTCLSFKTDKQMSLDCLNGWTLATGNWLVSTELWKLYRVRLQI